MKTTSHGRRPKNIKSGIYISKHLLDPSQILNLGLDDKTVTSQYQNWNISSPVFGTYSNLSLDDQDIYLKSSKLRRPPQKKTSNYLKQNISATIVWIVTYEFLEGNYRKTQMKS